MPAYPWLYENALDTSLTSKKIAAMKTLGTPYSNSEVKQAKENLSKQARQIAQELVAQGVDEDLQLAKTEIVALIAYMQRLGSDIKSNNKAATEK
jgi:cytochrome c oxidase cbb3-type subunit I/II